MKAAKWLPHTNAELQNALPDCSTSSVLQNWQFLNKKTTDYPLRLSVIFELMKCLIGGVLKFLNFKFVSFVNIAFFLCGFPKLWFKVARVES